METIKISEVKQVIVIRKDLKMRRGKEIAQGSHASIKWLAEKAVKGSKFTVDEKAWLEGSFTKICLQVNSEEELLDVYQRALAAGLTAKLITDAGRTEFDGVPTRTCIAIGPNKAQEIDKITGNLKLY
jgi:PTH2 family peptidyl-tRNA hydrolase